MSVSTNWRCVRGSCSSVFRSRPKAASVESRDHSRTCERTCRQAGTRSSSRNPQRQLVNRELNGGLVAGCAFVADHLDHFGRALRISHQRIEAAQRRATSKPCGDGRVDAADDVISLGLFGLPRKPRKPWVRLWTAQWSADGSRANCSTPRRCHVRLWRQPTILSPCRPGRMGRLEFRRRARADRNQLSGCRTQ